VECRIVGNETAHLEPWIVAEMGGRDLLFLTSQQQGSGDAGKRLVRFLDDDGPGRAGAADAGRLARRDVREAARFESIRADSDAPVEHIDKSLIAAGGKGAATLEFGGVLHECRSTDG